MRADLPWLGVGVGYRRHLHDELMAHREEIDFFEILTAANLGGGPGADRLSEVTNALPWVPHGTGLSIGTAGGLDKAYVTSLAEFVNSADPPWYSDHLSYSRAPGTDSRQLMPLWFAE